VPDRRRSGGAAQAQQEPGGGNALVPLLTYHEVEQPPSMSVVAELKREREADRGRAQSKTIAVIADPVFSADDERCCKSPRRGTGRKSAGRPAATGRPSVTERAAARGSDLVGRERIGRLGFTQLEAEEILSLFPRDEWLKAVGFDANLSLLTDPDRLAPYRILHFATHGLLNPEHPELSGILLSMLDEQGRRQDGFLQMHQIYNLHLPAEMVVLSACETGVGKETRGEGLNGISRGFMYAGAKRVVASLWEVNDASTSQLMKSFYQSLRPDGASHSMRPAAAMREAQLKLMKQRIWLHPYYWAAFVVQGAPG
jgi:CHAT domain-containing protein